MSKAAATGTTIAQPTVTGWTRLLLLGLPLLNPRWQAGQGCCYWDYHCSTHGDRLDKAAATGTTIAQPTVTGWTRLLLLGLPLLNPRWQAGQGCCYWDYHCSTHGDRLDKAAATGTTIAQPTVTGWTRLLLLGLPLLNPRWQAGQGCCYWDYHCSTHGDRLDKAAATGTPIAQPTVTGWTRLLLLGLPLLNPRWQAGQGCCYWDYHCSTHSDRLDKAAATGTTIAQPTVTGWTRLLLLGLPLLNPRWQAGQGCCYWDSHCSTHGDRLDKAAATGTTIAQPTVTGWTRLLLLGLPLLNPRWQAGQGCCYWDSHCSTHGDRLDKAAATGTPIAQPTVTGWTRLLLLGLPLLNPRWQAGQGCCYWDYHCSTHGDRLDKAAATGTTIAQPTVTGWTRLLLLGLPLLNPRWQAGQGCCYWDYHCSTHGDRLDKAAATGTTIAQPTVTGWTRLLLLGLPLLNPRWLAGQGCWLGCCYWDSHCSTHGDRLDKAAATGTTIAQPTVTGWTRLLLLGLPLLNPRWQAGQGCCYWDYHCSTHGDRLDKAAATGTTIAQPTVTGWTRLLLLGLPLLNPRWQAGQGCCYWDYHCSTHGDRLDKAAATGTTIAQPTVTGWTRLLLLGLPLLNPRWQAGQGCCYWDYHCSTHGDRLDKAAATGTTIAQPTVTGWTRLLLLGLPLLNPRWQAGQGCCYWDYHCSTHGDRLDKAAATGTTIAQPTVTGWTRLLLQGCCYWDYHCSTHGDRLDKAAATGTTIAQPTVTGWTRLLLLGLPLLNPRWQAGQGCCYWDYHCSTHGDRLDKAAATGTPIAQPTVTGWTRLLLLGLPLLNPQVTRLAGSTRTGWQGCCYWDSHCSTHGDRLDKAAATGTTIAQPTVTGWTRLLLLGLPLLNPRWQAGQGCCYWDSHCSTHGDRLDKAAATGTTIAQPTVTGWTRLLLLGLPLLNPRWQAGQGCCYWDSHCSTHGDRLDKAAATGTPIAQPTVTGWTRLLLRDSHCSTHGDRLDKAAATGTPIAQPTVTGWTRLLLLGLPLLNPRWQAGQGCCYWDYHCSTHGDRLDKAAATGTPIAQPTVTGWTRLLLLGLPLLNPRWQAGQGCCYRDYHCSTHGDRLDKAAATGTTIAQPTVTGWTRLLLLGLPLLNPRWQAGQGCCYRDSHCSTHGDRLDKAAATGTPIAQPTVTGWTRLLLLGLPLLNPRWQAGQGCCYWDYHCSTHGDRLDKAAATGTTIAQPTVTGWTRLLLLGLPLLNPRWQAGQGCCYWDSHCSTHGDRLDKAAATGTTIAQPTVTGWTRLLLLGLPLLNPRWQAGQGCCYWDYHCSTHGDRLDKAAATGTTIAQPTVTGWTRLLLLGLPLLNPRWQAGQGCCYWDYHCSTHGDRLDKAAATGTTIGDRLDKAAATWDSHCSTHGDRLDKAAATGTPIAQPTVTGWTRLLLPGLPLLNPRWQAGQGCCYWDYHCSTHGDRLDKAAATGTTIAQPTVTGWTRLLLLGLPLLNPRWQAGQGCCYWDSHCSTHGDRLDKAAATGTTIAQPTVTGWTRLLLLGLPLLNPRWQAGQGCCYWDSHCSTHGDRLDKAAATGTTIAQPTVTGWTRLLLLGLPLLNPRWQAGQGCCYWDSHCSTHGDRLDKAAATGTPIAQPTVTGWTRLLLLGLPLLNPRWQAGQGCCYWDYHCSTHGDRLDKAAATGTPIAQPTVTGWTRLLLLGLPLLNPRWQAGQGCCYWDYHCSTHGDRLDKAAATGTPIAQPTVTGWTRLLLLGLPLLNPRWQAGQGCCYWDSHCSTHGDRLDKAAATGTTIAQPTVTGWTRLLLLGLPLLNPRWQAGQGCCYWDYHCSTHSDRLDKAAATGTTIAQPTVTGWTRLLLLGLPLLNPQWQAGQGCCYWDYHCSTHSDRLDKAAATGTTIAQPTVTGWTRQVTMLIVKNHANQNKMKHAHT